MKVTRFHFPAILHHKQTTTTTTRKPTTTTKPICEDTWEGCYSKTSMVSRQFFVSLDYFFVENISDKCGEAEWTYWGGIMKNQCAKTCGFYPCDANSGECDDEDLHEDCQSYKGNCNKEEYGWKKWMDKNCAKTCQC